MNIVRSQQQWIDRAKAVLPAGGFGNYDAELFIRSGVGSKVIDENGKEYIDYLIGSGPMILGHGHPEVIEAVIEQLSSGFTFFANNASGVELAEEICRSCPCADKVRFVSSGGEADMYAMRVARAHTGRQKILKFEGGYHGMSAEGLMSTSPSRLRDFPAAVPDSAGILPSVEKQMLIAPFNDLEVATQIIEEYADQIAAIIVEPVQRLIPPVAGFLEGLRQLATRHAIVLIFDEIVTGYRISYGGAQSLYGVVPDLCTLGKVIGGGFPLAAITGAEDLMSHFDKSLVGRTGFTFQVGTLSGNPVASVAGLKTLEILAREGSYQRLQGHGEILMQALSETLSHAGLEHRVVGGPTMFDVVFTSHDVSDYRDLLQSDLATAKRFSVLLRKRGILKSPARMYSSLALTDDDIERTITAFQESAIDLGQESTR